MLTKRYSCHFADHAGVITINKQKTRRFKSIHQKMLFKDNLKVNESKEKKQLLKGKSKLLSGMNKYQESLLEILKMYVEGHGYQLSL